MPGLSYDDINNLFSFHAPPDEQTKKDHEQVREVCRKAAQDIKGLTPDSAEQTTAIRKLQEAMMHANAAIAVHGRKVIGE